MPQTELPPQPPQKHRFAIFGCPVDPLELTQEGKLDQAFWHGHVFREDGEGVEECNDLFTFRAVVGPQGCTDEPWEDSLDWNIQNQSAGTLAPLAAKVFQKKLVS